MQIQAEIHDTVDKTVKYDWHIKLLAHFPRHQIPISALPSGFSHTCVWKNPLPFWLLITNSFLCLYSVQFKQKKKIIPCLHARLDGWWIYYNFEVDICSGLTEGNSRKAVNCGDTRIHLLVGCTCWFYKCSCTKKKKQFWLDEQLETTRSEI